ncbi:MAG: hypothetical protein K2Y18_08470 [Alphaproteobacteria bacterium]|nr:hypothetical protein [Alphaproteobacteria bacterium]
MHSKCTKNTSTSNFPYTFKRRFLVSLAFLCCTQSFMTFKAQGVENESGLRNVTHPQYSPLPEVAIDIDDDLPALEYEAAMLVPPDSRNARDAVNNLNLYLPYVDAVTENDEETKTAIFEKAQRRNLCQNPEELPSLLPRLAKEATTAKGPLQTYFKSLGEQIVSLIQVVKKSNEEYNFLRDKIKLERKQAKEAQAALTSRKNWIRNLGLPLAFTFGGATAFLLTWYLGR